MKILFRIVFAATLVVAVSARSADVFTGGSLAQPSGVAFFNSFDPKLGTLTKVEIMITDSALILLNTPAYYPPADPGGEPVSYNFTYGESEELKSQFTEIGTAQYVLSGDAAAGVPTTQIPISYSYTIQFNTQTDLDGGIGVFSLSAETEGTLLPPTLITAKLSAFIGPPGQTIPFQLADLFFPDSGVPSATTGLPVYFDGITGAGNLVVDTPTPYPSPA